MLPNIKTAAFCLLLTAVSLHCDIPAVAQQSKISTPNSQRLTPASELYAAKMQLIGFYDRDGRTEEAAKRIEQTRKEGQGQFEWGYWNREYNAAVMTLDMLDEQAQVLALSPDGTRLLLARKQGAELWNVDTHAKIAPFAAQGKPLSAAAFTPDGERLVTGTESGTVEIRDAETGNNRRTLATENQAIRTVDVSSDSRRLLYTTLKKAVVCELETGKVLRSFETNSQSVKVWRISPQGNSVFLAETNGIVRELGIDGIQERLIDQVPTYSYNGSYGANSINRNVEISPDGTLLLNRNWEGNGSLTATQKNGSPLELTRLPSLPMFGMGGMSSWTMPARPPRYSNYSIPIRQQNARVVSIEHIGNVLLLHEEGTWRILRTFRTTADHFERPVVARNGMRLAVSDSMGRIHVWNLEGDVPWEPLTDFHPMMNVGAVSPDGKLFSYIAKTGALVVRKSADGTQVMRLEIPSNGNPSARWQVQKFFPDGRHLLTAGWKIPLMIWDARTGKKIREIVNGTDGATAADISRDGKRILTASRDTAKLWDATTGRLLTSCRTPRDISGGAILSADGKHAALLGYGDFAWTWNIADNTLKPLSSFQNVRSNQVQPPFRNVLFRLPFDGRSVAVGMWQGNVRLIDSGFNGFVCSFGSLPLPPITAMLSADGTRLVTGGQDGKVRLWDTASGKEMMVFGEQGVGFLLAGITADHRRVFALDDNGVLFRWRADFHAGQKGQNR